MHILLPSSLTTLIPQQKNKKNLFMLQLYDQIPWLSACTCSFFGWQVSEIAPFFKHESYVFRIWISWHQRYAPRQSSTRRLDRILPPPPRHFISTARSLTDVTVSAGKVMNLHLNPDKASLCFLPTNCTRHIHITSCYFQWHQTSFPEDKRAVGAIFGCKGQKSYTGGTGNQGRLL